MNSEITPSGLSKKRGSVIRAMRIATQWTFFLLFLYMFFLPLLFPNGLKMTSEYFFYFDPLFLISNLLLTKTILLLALLALIPLILTLLLGRFFCGWICPLGSIHQFFSWLFHPFRLKASGPNKKLLGIKYLVLAIVIVPVFAGINFTGWLDPFSLLTRSLALFTPLFDPGHVSVRPFLTGGLFILLIALNSWQPRFFCNALCPLGAMYGLVASVGLFRFRTVPSCNKCQSCSAHCTFGGNAGEEFLKSECLLCFNCTTDCPGESVIVELELPKKETLPEVIPGRRKFLGALALGGALAILPSTARPEKRRLHHGFIRPPGARQEAELLARCERCGQCVQSCSTGFIQPASLEAGIEGLWTPVASGRTGYCAWECNTCTLICPSMALMPLTLKEKQRFRIGSAVIDKDRCFTYSDGFNCTVCQERCPTPEKAIRFRTVEVWNYQGKRSLVQQVYVDPDLCIGCGICEFFCPRTDAPAISVVSEDEYREMVR